MQTDFFTKQAHSNSGQHMHDCKKHDCFFCYEINRINTPRKEIDVYVHGWPESKVNIILNNLDIIPDVPGYSRRQVMHKRSYIGRKLKIKLKNLRKYPLK